MARRAIGDFGDDDLPVGPAMSILPELGAGETLIWRGRPRSPHRLVMRTIPKALFGLAFLAFTLFWMAMVVLGGHNNWDKGRAVRPFETHNVLIATLAGLWMIPPGLYMLTWSLRTWRRLRGTCYALTDRRAIISEPGLLGHPKVRSYAAGSLRLMRLEEHEDGTGDLIFESPSTWVGMAQTVGFLAIEEAREVEALVRRTLSPGDQPASHVVDRLHGGEELGAAPIPRVISPPRAYKLPLFSRILLIFFGVVFSLSTLLIAARVIVVPLALVISVRPIAVVLGSISGDYFGLVICLVVFVFLTHSLLTTPVEITIEGGTVSFRSWFRSQSVQVGDITSMRTGGWADPNRFNAVIRHKGGRMTLLNQFADFPDFLATLRELNPAVEIKGF